MRVPGVQDDGEAELWRPVLLSFLALIEYTQIHTRSYCIPAHFITLTHTHPHGAYLLSTHAQTFTKLPPGFDGWSVSALPPVSYTHNLIWGPHGGSHTKQS